MAQNNERNYKIPDPAIGFHATGLYGLKRKEVDLLESILEPVKKYFDCPRLKHQPHISCRYLGYRDEADFERIREIIPLLKEIYDKFLPIECSVGRLFTSWEPNPNYKSKLLMVKMQSPKLKLLHEEILQKTKKFSVFSGVEGENFNPHFTLGSLKEEFEDEIPEEVSDFVRNTKIKPSKIFLRAAYIHAEKGMGFQEILRTQK